MTLRTKIAERLRSLSGFSSPATVEFIARDFERGDFDDILGVAEPTIADVDAECERTGLTLSFGSSADISFSDEEQDHQIDHIRISSERNETRIQYRGHRCVEYAYAAVRALPSKGGA